jgi:hypothetical protein
MAGVGYVYEQIAIEVCLSFYLAVSILMKIFPFPPS